RALSSIAPGNPEVFLTVAGHGDPDYVASLRSLAGDLGVSTQVEWLGHVEGKQKARALATAAAFVLPSYSENFGLAVVEALAAGLPCIVSRGVAVAREIEIGAAGFVTGTDAESIAAAIRRLLRDRNAHAAMSAAARKLASSAFSLEAMGERLETLYR